MSPPVRTDRSTASKRSERGRVPLLLALLLAACGGGGGGDDDGTPIDANRGGGPDASPAPYCTPKAGQNLRLQLITDQVVKPVTVAAPPADPRLFVVEQPGRIRIVKAGQLLATPFLDIAARVRSGGERGLLSMAFHPAFASNGHFFVYYTNLDGDIVVERFTAAAGADVASATTSVPVITIPHRRFDNHNGGLVAFGPDGMLYLGTGDGGSGGDPDNNAQNLASLLGKLLRLDVSALPYTIPPSNPFVGQAGRRPEIWAYGLRNPWRFAFAPATASLPAMLFVADVGQDAREEVNVVRADAAGINYGWRLMEGERCFNPSTGCETAGLQLPVRTYDHDRGCSIIGGPMYRGATIELRGHWFYSDFCGRWLESLTGSTAVGWTRHTWSIPTYQGSPLGFGEDSSGGIYLTTNAGIVYRIVKLEPAT